MENNSRSVEKVDLFSTPVWISSIENYIELKDDIILSLEKIRSENLRGVYKSNYIGYQSDDITSLLELKPVFEHVMQKMVGKAIQDLELAVTRANIKHSWVNINDTLNAFNVPHSHHGLFSGIIYINAPDGSGELVFLNDGYNELWTGNELRNKTRISSLYASSCSVIPRDGMVILWASFLKHYVKPNTKDVNRISISFNIDLEKVNQEK